MYKSVSPGAVQLATNMKEHTYPTQDMFSINCLENLVNNIKNSHDIILYLKLPDF